MSKVKLIKTLPKGSVGDKILFAQGYGAKLLEHKASLTGIKYDDVVVLALVALIIADEILSKKGDTAATARYKANLAKFADMYYQNGLYVEDKINLAHDNDLALKLGYIIQKTTGPHNRAAASGENTSTKGVIKVRVIKVGVTNHYDIYGQIVTDEGMEVAVKIGILGKTTGLVKNLISGAKYSVYAIPVDSNGNEGEPTTAFIIRVS